MTSAHNQDASQNRLIRSLSGVFNGKVMPDRLKPEAQRLRELRHVVGLIAEGRELLKQADELGIIISIHDEYNNKTDSGHFMNLSKAEDENKNQRFIQLNNVKNNTALVVILIHELRHMSQDVNANAFQGRNLRPSDLFTTMRVTEADAFAYSFLCLLKLKEKGHPQYLQSCNQDQNFYQRATQMLQTRGYGGAADDMAFTRDLFMHFQNGNLGAYDYRMARDLARDACKAMPEDYINLATAEQPWDDGKLHRLTTINGKSYLEGMSLSDVVTVARNSLAPEINTAITLSDTARATAGMMKKEEFADINYAIQSNVCSWEERTTPPLTLRNVIEMNVFMMKHKYKNIFDLNGWKLLEKATGYAPKKSRFDEARAKHAQESLLLKGQAVEAPATTQEQTVKPSHKAVLRVRAP